VLTGTTVWVSQIDLGAWNIVVALAIASIKAMLVAFFFMHLYYDHKFYFITFAIAVVFLVVFIGFTFIDTLRRGDLYEEVASPITEQAIIYSAPADSAAGNADSIVTSGEH
jgi:cytochrome c oxidase subunit 4